MKTDTKIGDIFSAVLDDQHKRFFQYIANDITQLNSDVIRVFSRKYTVDENPLLSEIVNDGIDFYAHAVTKWGIKMNLWKKEGNIKDIGTLDHILFKDTSDYGGKPGEQIKKSSKWFVWRINDGAFTRVGTLDGENKNAYTGLIINPHGIIELLKGNKYPINYPE